jgi:transcriptional regulator with XRE-family HTH domain
VNLTQAMQRVAKNVRRLRLGKHLTQEQMVDYGFNYRYFQKIEAGQVNLTLGSLIRLATALNCKIDDLLK